MRAPANAELDFTIRRTHLDSCRNGCSGKGGGRDPDRAEVQGPARLTRKPKHGDLQCETACPHGGCTRCHDDVSVLFVAQPVGPRGPWAGRITQQGFGAMGVLDEFTLDGCRAVVTGAGKGIGRGIAVCLAEAGADVAVSSRTSADLFDVVAEIEAAGRVGLAHEADVTVPGAQAALAAAAVERFGGIDIWVNNAGGLPDATARYLTRTNRQQWQAQLDLNLTAVWDGCVAAAKQMADGGSIVNISSGAATGPQLKNGPYGAAKAAVNSLTETLSVELAPAIRVNAVSPGPIPTPNFVESTDYRGERKAMIDKQMRIPLGRLGTDRDIGAAVVFLASPAASWITGQVLRVSGGR